jgi:hypothetical protein
MALPQLEALERRRLLSSGTYDFGQVGNYSVKAVVEGPGRTVTTFALLGGGSGHVVVSGSGLDVTLDNTSSATSLVISTKGGRTQLHSLSDTGSIGKISGALVDMAGDVTIGGTISSLQLGNVFGGHAINIGSGVAGADIVLGTATDTSLASGTPFKSFSINGWYDTDSIADPVSVPWIGSMKVKADFNGTLNTASIGSASVGGSWGGTTNITGNAGTLKMSHLRGSLSIGGKSEGISTKDYLFLGNGGSPTGGVLHIAGSTHVKSAREKFMAVNATLYAALTSHVYSTEQLLAYDSVGSSWNYNASASVNKIAVTGSSTDQVQPTQSTIDTRPSWLVDSTDSATHTSTTTGFYRDASGTYENEFDTTDDLTGESLRLDLGLLKLAPPSLGLGQSSFSSKRIAGTLHLPASVTGSGSAIDTPASGTASLSMKLVGHESVIVPAGTFLAVRMQITRTFDVSAFAHIGLFVFQRTIHISQTSTIFAVPGIGVVQESSNSLERTGTLGSANQSIATREDRLLASHS